MSGNEAIEETFTRARLLHFIEQNLALDGRLGVAGSDGQIQFNNDGAHGASPNLTYAIDGIDDPLLGKIGTLSVSGSFGLDSGRYGLHITGSGWLGPAIQSYALLDIIDNRAAGGHPILQVTGSAVTIGHGQPAALLHISASALAGAAGTTGGEGAPHLHNSLFRIDGYTEVGETGATTTETILYVSSSTDVGIATLTPKVHLDVNHGYVDWLANDTGGGETVQFGDSETSTTAGKLYFLDTDSDWQLVDASSVSTGASQLLGIALGTAVQDGMLIRGFFDAHSALTASHSPGKAVYASENGGAMHTVAPNTSNAFVRVLGYCTTDARVIYFNPDGTYIKVA